MSGVTELASATAIKLREKENICDDATPSTAASRVRER